MWSLTFRFPDQNSVCISILTHTYSMPRPLHPALLNLTLSGESYKHEAPHFAFISSLLSFIPSQAQISSTSLYCRTPSSLCRPSIGQPKFHIHTKHATCILITVFLDSKREGKGSEYHATAHKPTCHNLQARRVESTKLHRVKVAVFVDKRSIKTIYNVPLGYPEVTGFPCIFQTTFKTFAQTQNGAHTFLRPVKLIPKRQTFQFFMDPLCSFRDMESEAKESAVPCPPAEFITIPVAAHFKILQKIQVRKTNLLLLK